MKPISLQENIWPSFPDGGSLAYGRKCIWPHGVVSKVPFPCHYGTIHVRFDRDARMGVQPVPLWLQITTYVHRNSYQEYYEFLGDSASSRWFVLFLLPKNLSALTNVTLEVRDDCDSVWSTLAVMTLFQGNIATHIYGTSKTPGSLRYLSDLGQNQYKWVPWTQRGLHLYIVYCSPLNWCSLVGSLIIYCTIAPFRTSGLSVCHRKDIGVVLSNSLDSLLRCWNNVIFQIPSRVTGTSWPVEL